MEQLIGSFVLICTGVLMYGAFLMFLDKQRSFILRRELENRRYNREGQVSNSWHSDGTPIVSVLGAIELMKIDFMDEYL